MTALHLAILPAPLARLARWRARRAADRSLDRHLDRLSCLSPHLLADIGVDLPAPPRPPLPPAPPRTVA